MTHKGELDQLVKEATQMLTLFRCLRQTIVLVLEEVLQDKSTNTGLGPGGKGSSTDANYVLMPTRHEKRTNAGMCLLSAILNSLYIHTNFFVYLYYRISC